MDAVETMMYVGATPWHGLGTALEEPPSVEEAIRLAGLDWNVTIKPLFTEEGDLDGAPILNPVPSHVATVRESDGSILGVVGKRFVPLQNEDAFKFFNPLVESKLVNLECAGSLHNGRRVWVLAKINNQTKEVTSGDPVEAYLLLAHAHDGTLAVRVGFTPVRVVCQNTLSYSMQHNDSKLIRILHTKNMNKALDAVRDIMNVTAQTFEATTAQYRTLAGLSIDSKTLEEYVQRVVIGKIAVEDLTKEESEQGKRVMKKIIPLFEDGIGSNLARGSWWNAYNAITEFTSHKRGRSQDTRVESLWFGQSKQMNQNALDIALQMAA
jgi:phage/plasmid-like protein (TIGR03299 family)